MELLEMIVVSRLDLVQPAMVGMQINVLFCILDFTRFRIDSLEFIRMQPSSILTNTYRCERETPYLFGLRLQEVPDVCRCVILPEVIVKSLNRGVVQCHRLE